MRTTFATMGTVASLAFDDEVSPATLAEVESVFADYDRDFSLYRDDSEVSAIARGELSLVDAGERFRDEYARSLRWRARTAGWFDPHRPDGVIDLSGTIKAVAIAEAATLLAAVGATGVLDVGGDILAIGSGTARVGIVDPSDRSALIADVVLDTRRALATSGSAERGDHIWARYGSTDILQASVLADDIVTADVMATAIVAAGTASMDDLLDAADIDVLVVTRDGLLATPGWPRVSTADRSLGR